jgi:DHA1 family bicyclomycin/chloramphenicol resistance-like MFS transporter
MLPLSVMLVLGAVVALGPLAIDMYLPALPHLQNDFQTDAAAVQLTLAAFFVGIALGQLVYGPISDRFGRRRPMLFGLTGFVFASVGCAYASSIETLIVLRFVQAMTGCAGMVITRAIVRDLFPPQEMARVLSLLVLVMGVAPVLAPSLGGLVLQWYDWRLLFWLLAFFAFACVLAVWRILPESLPVERRQTTISVRSVLANYRHVLSHRRFVGYALSGGIAQAGMFAYISASAFVFIQHYGLSPNEFAALFGLNAFGLICASQINRSVLRRWPVQRVLGYAIGSYALSGIGMTIMAASGFGGIWGVTIPLWICMSCLGFTFPNSTAAAMAPFGDRAGSASGMLGTMQFTVAGLASATVGHFSAQGALPMAIVIASCGAMSWTLLRWVRDH